MSTWDSILDFQLANTPFSKCLNCDEYGTSILILHWSITFEVAKFFFSSHYSLEKYLGIIVISQQVLNRKMRALMITLLFRSEFMIFCVHGLKIKVKSTRNHENSKKKRLYIYERTWKKFPPFRYETSYIFMPKPKMWS